MHGVSEQLLKVIILFQIINLIFLGQSNDFLGLSYGTFDEGEHQPCIWMSRLFEAALLLAWAWFGIAIVFTWCLFVWSKKSRYVLDFWGADAV